MEFIVKTPKSEVERLLADVPVVEKIREIKGGSLIVTDLSFEVASIRNEIEQRLGPALWLN